MRKPQDAGQMRHEEYQSCGGHLAKYAGKRGVLRSDAHQPNPRRRDNTAPPSHQLAMPPKTLGRRPKGSLGCGLCHNETLEIARTSGALKLSIVAMTQPEVLCGT